MVTFPWERNIKLINILYKNKENNHDPITLDRHHGNAQSAVKY